MTDGKVFIDTSAFLALYIQNDDFHERAVDCLMFLNLNQVNFITSNFIIDETYTFLRSNWGKKTALGFADLLADNSQFIKIDRVSIDDEKTAFKYFETLDGRGVSFTDCTSFAMMKRIGIETAYTFDRDFERAGFKIIP